jgi:hypothetical protein
MNTIDFTKFTITSEGFFVRNATNTEDKYERHKQRCRISNRKLYHADDTIRLRKRTLALALRIHYGENIKPETLLQYTPHMITFAVDVNKMLERARLRAVAAAAPEEQHTSHDDA